ncbi:hypothetical protein D9Q98_006520 [Chlorella vulgaris]|uniref:Uncharacterized protein n=1 Tax=Chlorella vulgaris TaxID=3077 RepID=A0A9D4TKQ6_CHLVU|nr:hypothetical protein D9Q98_006520 [Chlorella vulgaris]
MHQAGMRLALLLVAAVYICAPVIDSAPLQPKPVFLTYRSFKPHPKGCNTANPLHMRVEYSWKDTVADHGTTIQQGCFPYNQIIPTKGFWRYSTTQSKSPDALEVFQIRLRRPDSREICLAAKPDTCLKPVTNQVYRGVPMTCDVRTYMDVGQYYGPPGCIYNQFRLGDTTQNCKIASYPAAYNVVKHHPGTVSTIPGSSKIACTWDDAMPYDLSAVPGTGSMQFEMMTNIHFFKNDLATAKQPKSPKRFFAQLLPSIPVMTNQPTKPCDVSAAAADRKYCDYSSPDAHTLNVKGWNERTQFTQVEFTPYFLIPVGGVYRTFMSVSRMVEPAPAAYKFKGYPVSKTVVTLDKAIGLTTQIEVVHGCPPSVLVPFFTHVTQDFAGTYTEKPSVTYTQTAGSANYKLAAFQPTQKSNWILLQFDLSFLSSFTKVSSAELHIFVSSVNVETKQLTKAVIDVYDGSKTQKRNGKTFPCVPPFCTTARKLGTGTFNGAVMGKIKGKYMKLSVDPTYLRNFVGKTTRMPLALVMPQQPGRTKVTVDGVIFRAKNTGSAPMLVMKASC